MAPVEVHREPRVLPTVLAVLHVVAAVYASYTVGRSLYQAHKALGPAEHTRHRRAQRTKLTAAFGSLAALSLIFAITSSLDYLTLSYKVWASERGIQVPDSLFGYGALNTNSTNEPSFHLRYWLSDTPVYLDALEIIAEKTRRWWWGQQLDLATVSWITLIAVEGRRRQIPHPWAYALLSHLVNLSFAQNLFYVALLQAPSTITMQKSRIAQVLHRMLPKKPAPANWFPNPSLLIVPLALNYLVMLCIPVTAGTPFFLTTVALNKLLTLAPLILPGFAPASWGTAYADPRDAYTSITKVYNLISTASALLHAKNTASALLYNLPSSYKHRHSIKIPFDTKKRSKWERTATAAEKVLDAITDHPAVAAAGKDALLCALSLGLWAAVRSTDAHNMLRSVYSGLTRTALPPRSASEVLRSSRRAKAAAATEPASPHGEEEEESAHNTPSGVPPLSMTLRRRGRPKKTSVSIFGSFDGHHAEDATAGAASTTAQQTPPRRRGRPRKVNPEPEPKPEQEPEQNGTGPEEDLDDKTYEPTPAVEAEVGLADVLPEDDFDWEPAALAWGLTAIGGLGLGSAAVFGVECVSR
ncbi:hypothetical protein N658DRAFT_491062 [Parathielavia hyrcaniae]|uniref:Uncharacterized protein n=1 Tax=Parathielavia hyrcaniae TaxID=113614 RepID=A0AAN6QA65_9PEZI|nr:hypothetical protein N658DRAFT_491062 [Parathielavia hyrcaniae]